MLKVGLTGSIASGKSAVAQMFAKFGAHVAYADKIAHDLMQPGQPVYEEIVRRFRRDILDTNGTINRKKLADAAFGTPQNPSSRVEELNAIVHPAVVRFQDDWMAAIGRRQPGAVTIVEAALIFEARADKRFDRIIVVTCPFETRVQRWMVRTGADEPSARQELERRMSAQIPEEEKIRKADHVIDNSETLDATERQVRELYAKLKEQARTSAT